MQLSINAYRRCLSCFAELLDYPQPGVVEAARTCEALVTNDIPEAGKYMSDFRAFLEDTPPRQLEELFTTTFDLAPQCYPYVGYHLFGETYQRSMFLLGLKERYRPVGLEPKAEMTDHVAVMLRFLAADPGSDEAQEIARDALLPALLRMTGQVASAGFVEEEDGLVVSAEHQAHEQYLRLLEALRLVVEALVAVGDGQAVLGDDLASPSLSGVRRN